MRTIAVIGAGRAGREIARRSALAGYRTILEDVLPASLRRAQDEIRNILDQEVGVGTVNRALAQAAIARIEFATTMEDAAREADMVIEAVPDEFDSKEEIFRLLDRICRPSTLLVTTTTSLSVTEIAAIIERPEEIVGIQFLEHGGIKVLQGSRSADEPLKLCLSFAHRLSSEVTLAASTNVV